MLYKSKKRGAAGTELLRDAVKIVRNLLGLDSSNT